ncbi:MAG: family N-acetyltransferase, partial [Ramlibacter sp.]|nr:family N-acetyltransferase [Ramlibacter sp.]
MQKSSNDYVTRVLRAPSEVDAAAWNALLARAGASPFMRHEYLDALHASGSAAASTGWDPHFITLWRGGALQAACPLYLKSHSYGEYVFDWAWANAYEQHGVRYYPKALTAVPFTPVPGPRLLAVDATARLALVQGVRAWCVRNDVAACTEAGLMLRHTVQFHWLNEGWTDFDAFLASLTQEKRKKIRQERRKVAEAGVTFRHAQGQAIAPADWDFFYRCYERTYLEHGNAPYLAPGFFERMAQAMPENWLLFIAQRDGKPVASSLIGIGGDAAYGRYWGALERVDCLHFEACYYQPLAWCIANGYQRFEGG